MSVRVPASRDMTAPAEVQGRTGLCECGCGKSTGIARQTINGATPPVHRGWPNAYLAGHVNRIRAVPEEVRARTGLCECGCGERTEIANRTIVRDGKYKGHPAARKLGHGAGVARASRTGRFTDQRGYVRVYMPEHPMADANGCVPEHRLVMAQSLGRTLAPNETVHHVNGDRADNRPENLQLRTGQHGAGVTLTCNTCGGHDITAAPLA